MMLRGNLATRPFYNERIVTLLLALVAAVVLALTVTNVTRLLQLSARRSELRAQIGAMKPRPLVSGKAPRLCRVWIRMPS